MNTLSCDKSCKIKFRFTFENGGTMETSYTGEPCKTKDEAIASTWKAMSAESFDRNLITSTEKIEKLKIEFL